MHFDGHLRNRVFALFQHFGCLFDVRQRFEDAFIVFEVDLGGLGILGFERDLSQLVVRVPVIGIERDRGAEFLRVSLSLIVAFECVSQLKMNGRFRRIAPGSLFQLRDGLPNLTQAQVRDAGEIVRRRRMAVDGQHLLRFSQRLFVHAGQEMRPGQVQSPRRLCGEQLDRLAERLDRFAGLAVFVLRFADIEQ